MPAELITLPWASSRCAFFIIITIFKFIFAWMKNSRRVFGTCSGVSVNFEQSLKVGLESLLVIYTPRNQQEGEKKTQKNFVLSRNKLEGFFSRIFGMEGRGGRWQGQLQAGQIQEFLHNGLRHQSLSAVKIWLFHKWDSGQQVQGCGVFKSLPKKF